MGRKKHGSFLNAGSAEPGVWRAEVTRSRHSQGHLLLSEDNIGTQVDPSDRSHPPPSRGLEEEHHPLYPEGAKLLSQAAKPERLARARRSKTFQLTSAMSPSAPAIAQCSPPGLPVSTARPAPPPRATLSGGTPAGSELPGRRRPSSLASWSSEGQPQASVRVQRGAVRELAPCVFSRSAGRTVLCGCRQAQRRPAGPRAPWRRACCPAPGCCWRRCSWGSRC